MLLCTTSSRLGVVVIFAALVALSAPSVSQGTSFLADVDDLPLAPGLVEDAASRVAFDKPEGRIVQALASGPMNAIGVRRFYAETLPTLGWRAGAAGEWSRGRETLRMNIETTDGAVVVLFSITPRAAP